MKKILVLAGFLFVLLLPNTSRATHIVGGEVYYDSLGNNTYKVTFEIFRDCTPGTSAFDNPLNYTIFYANGTIWSQFSVPANLIEQLPIVYDDPCVTVPTDICVERAVYIDTVILPFDVDGYYITYTRCCWSGAYDNIVNPGDNGINITTTIPGSSLVDVPNQSARFTNYPQIVLCSSNEFTFDHSATDPDGDSLVYSIVAPWAGGSTADANPDPDDAAPYFPLTWNPGYSSAQPFGPGSNITIDQQTGLITVTPNNIGSFVAGVQVDEYREGILINSHIRTYGYRVVACQILVPVEVSVTGPTQLIEDCGFAGFIVTRDDTTSTLIVQVLLSGTATNGDDYPYIDDTLVIQQGVESDTIGISAFYDSITEGTETVFFNIIIEDPCDGTFDTTSISLNLIDYDPISVIATDSVNICGDMGETVLIGCLASSGVPPYGYYWQPWGESTDTILVTGSMLNPNYNPFIVFAQDACGKRDSAYVKVYNQCPLMTPNVITMNGDGNNDAFIIDNLDNFDRVSLTVVDRWGITVYHNDNYKNDWKGTDVSGKQLTEGVYFFTVTPESEKFDYDDVKRTKYTMHGFVHLYD